MSISLPNDLPIQNATQPSANAPADPAASAAERAPLAAEPSPATLDATRPPATKELRFDPFRHFQKLLTDWQHLQVDFGKRAEALRAEGKELSSKEWIQLNQEQNQQSQIMQMRVQQAAFGAELMSKVVEHGTSSTKSILQTQM
jgi:hypothetical protein